MSTILVIDDDEQIQSYLSKLLEGKGYAVRQARDGVEGIRSYRHEPADLVFCDIFMDRKEGLETIRQLLQEFPQAKIIAMSGGSALVPGDFLYLAGKFGAVATLNKPLDREFLVQTVHDVLDDGGGRRAGPIDRGVR